MKEYLLQNDLAYVALKLFGVIGVVTTALVMLFLVFEVFVSGGRK